MSNISYLTSFANSQKSKQIQSYSIMKRNSTLPVIKDPVSISLNKSKDGKETFRRLEDKVHSHDQQIVRNDKIISNLANEFRLLKEQLEFQQDYNEKHKQALSKYEQQTAKNQKIVKQYKHTLIKMDQIIKQKDKNIDNMSKQIKLSREKNEQLRSKHQQYEKSLEDLGKECRKKDHSIRNLELQVEKLKKQAKDKQLEMKKKEEEIRSSIKERQMDIRSQYESSRQIRESKIKKLQRDLELANIYLENNKEIMNSKDKQIHKLTLQMHAFEQRNKRPDKNQIRVKNLIQEFKLAQKENQQLRNKIKQWEELSKKHQSRIKIFENKQRQGEAEKEKQLHIQKRQLIDKFEKLSKDFEQFRKRSQASEKKQKQIQKLKGQIGVQLKKLKGNIICDFCSKQMKNPVTNIPCGHSYCQECKSGYLKQCKKCPGLKRQAVYRNELLDEIIQATNVVQKIYQLFH